MSVKGKLAAKITTRISKALKLTNLQSMQVYDIVLEILKRHI